MSRPRIPKSQLVSSPTRSRTPPRSDYNAFPMSPKTTSPRKRRAQPILYGRRDRTLAQQRFLPTPHGQFGILERTDTDIFAGSTNSGEEANAPLFTEDAATPPEYTPHRYKRLRQAYNWEFEVLPSLITPYTTYLRESSNLADILEPVSHECTCMSAGARLLDLVVIRFARIERLALNICECSPAASQLMERGLFGCAPLLPSLAVDIRVLDFVTRLFLRISPNVTAICSTLEDFFRSQGYQLQGKDPLRRRFSNALRWYNVLQQATNVMVEAVIRRACDAIGPETLEDGLGKVQGDDLFGDEALEPEMKRSRMDVSEARPLTRPSDYLRARCPLCFGGEGELQDGLSSIVCLDACFTQKHNKQQRDPPQAHPDTSFIPPDEVDRWVRIIEARRGKQKARPEPEDDRVEPGLKVPNSVLNGCNDSFTAADGDRVKASTQFFDATALMALLCRHDRVLWVVNMTTPGERQHYAFVLLETLFHHLPERWTIGLLYDIACQTERSCIKWGIFDEFLPRLSFAISVFHAFGHGWGCQCIYHPRKCIGFGLSDGEGCERFWHKISALIAYLRVCGHYTRLYTLDSQIQYINHSGLEGLGSLLARQWDHALSKRQEGELDVRYSMRTPEYLRSQWQAQVESSTRPLPRQSRTAAKKAVEAAVQLRRARDALVQSVRRLEGILSHPESEAYEVAEAEMELPVVRTKLQKVQTDLHAKEANLGVEGMQRYRHLATSPFLRDRMNARALKARICQRLRARKFERDRVERSFRRQQNTSERKLHNHVESTVKRRDGGIESLVQKYNRLCKSMSDAIAGRRAPRNATAPKPLNMKEIFTLDVDDSIWDDTGLVNEDDSDVPRPWLSDEQVRCGIRGILLRDRGNEQFIRLKHELRALESWFSEEWAVMERALADTSDVNVLHLLSIKRRQLCRLALAWTAGLAALPSEVKPSFDGPSQADIAAVEGRVDFNEGKVSTGTGTSDPIQDDEDGYVELENDDLDLGLVEHMDTLDIMDSRDDLDD